MGNRTRLWADTYSDAAPRSARAGLLQEALDLGGHGRRIHGVASFIVVAVAQVEVLRGKSAGDRLLHRRQRVEEGKALPAEPLLESRKDGVGRIVRTEHFIDGRDPDDQKGDVPASGEVLQSRRVGERHVDQELL